LFGKTYLFESFRSDPAFYIDNFLQTKHEIKKQYLHYQNHPILGRSYQTTAKDIAKILIKIIND
jgi:hypothetical protein